jgi:hypothetical protein
VVRSERLIKLRDSWFSAKSILVEHLKFFFFFCKALNKLWGYSLTEFNETKNKNKGFQIDKL